MGLGEDKILIPGAVGQLEVIVNEPKVVMKEEVAVICHPHPLFGGTMTNKVVHTIAKLYRDMGMRALRFNFRGVGASDGEYAEGIGECDDLLAVIEWAKQHYANPGFFINGFSFGSFVAYRSCALFHQHFDLQHLVTVAPAVEHFDFADLALPPCPLLVLQGLADEVVPAKLVLQWSDSLALAPTVIRFPEVGHFFHGHLVSLRNSMQQYFLENSI